MPLVRIDLVEGKSAEYPAGVATAVDRGLHHEAGTGEGGPVIYAPRGLLSSEEP